MICVSGFLCHQTDSTHTETIPSPAVDTWAVSPTASSATADVFLDVYRGYSSTVMKHHDKATEEGI